MLGCNIIKGDYAATWNSPLNTPYTNETIIVGIARAAFMLTGLGFLLEAGLLIACTIISKTHSKTTSKVHNLPLDLNFFSLKINETKSLNVPFSISLGLYKQLQELSGSDTFTIDLELNGLIQTCTFKASFLELSDPTIPLYEHSMMISYTHEGYIMRLSDKYCDTLYKLQILEFSK